MGPKTTHCGKLSLSQLSHLQKCSFLSLTLKNFFPQPLQGYCPPWTNLLCSNKYFLTLKETTHSSHLCSWTLQLFTCLVNFSAVENDFSHTGHSHWWSLRKTALSNSFSHPLHWNPLLCLDLRWACKFFLCLKLRWHSGHFTVLPPWLGWPLTSPGSVGDVVCGLVSVCGLGPVCGLWSVCGLAPACGLWAVAGLAIFVSFVDASVFAFLLWKQRNISFKN